MLLDKLLTYDEKEMLRKARESYIRDTPSIKFYSVIRNKEYDILYRFDADGNLLLNVSDILNAFKITMDSKSRYMSAEYLMRRVCYNLAEYIGYLNFIYSSVRIPRSDPRYDIVAMQRFWNDSTKEHTLN